MRSGRPRRARDNRQDCPDPRLHANAHGGRVRQAPCWDPVDLRQKRRRGDRRHAASELDSTSTAPSSCSSKVLGTLKCGIAATTSGTRAVGGTTAPRTPTPPTAAWISQGRRNSSGHMLHRHVVSVRRTNTVAREQTGIRSRTQADERHRGPLPHLARCGRKSAEEVGAADARARVGAAEGAEARVAARGVDAAAISASGAQKRARPCSASAQPRHPRPGPCG